MGWNTKPYVNVSAISGFNVMLPPTEVLICAAGLVVMLPHSAAVTPVRAQYAKSWPWMVPVVPPVPPMTGPQHGSAVPPAPMTAGANKSPTPGARTARL